MRAYIILSLCCSAALVMNVTYAVEYYKEQPSFVQSCKLYEPDFPKCSTAALQQFINQMNAGIPGLADTLGTFDPMHLEPVEMNEHSEGFGSLKLTLKNQIADGLAQIVVKDNRNSKRDLTGRTKFFIPKLHISGDYTMEGNVLLLPLKGNGTADFIFEDLEVLIVAGGHPYQMDGLTFFNVTYVNTKLEMSRFRTKLTNLFNGKSPEIEKSTNQFFNENWKDFVATLMPTLVKSFNQTFLKILNSYFSIIPLKFIIADLPDYEELLKRASEK